MDGPAAVDRVRDHGVHFSDRARAVETARDNVLVCPALAVATSSLFEFRVLVVAEWVLSAMRR